MCSLVRICMPRARQFKRLPVPVSAMFIYARFVQLFLLCLWLSWDLSPRTALTFVGCLNELQEKAPYVSKAEKLRAEFTKKIDAYNNPQV